MKISQLGLRSIFAKMPSPSSVVSPISESGPAVNVGKTGLQSITGKLPEVKKIPTLMDKMVSGVKSGVNSLINPVISPLGSEKVMATPKIATKVKAPMPTVTPTIPKATPTPAPRIFDYEKYANFPKGVEVPPQPPKEIADVLFNQFPNEATQAAIASKYESHWNPKAKSGLSPGGTYDHGLFQVSTRGTKDGTFEDLMKRKPGLMMKAGVNTVEDLMDPVKNSRVMNMIRDEEKINKQIPFRRTYGWQNQKITWR